MKRLVEHLVIYFQTKVKSWDKNGTKNGSILGARRVKNQKVLKKAPQKRVQKAQKNGQKHKKVKIFEQVKQQELERR
ncbi:MAG: hypothetical protein EAZ92_11460 [Candidatus Kapaibacterium sp.]|nr:MAG: hypothetical protein EAZ92_11460 [Candidatus Kapabacteria bacterium]